VRAEPIKLSTVNAALDERAEDLDVAWQVAIGNILNRPVVGMHLAVPAAELDKRLLLPLLGFDEEHVCCAAGFILHAEF